MDDVNIILWNKLKKHRGHKVDIVSYGDWDNPANVCLLRRAGLSSPFVKCKLHIRKVGKMKYLVKVREIFEHTYLVEAESKEAAEEIVIDNSDGCDPYDDLVDTVYETREPKDDEAIEYYDECSPKVKKKNWNSIDMLLDFKRQLNETII